MPERKLLSIFVEWRDEKGDRDSVTYYAETLGDSRARLRAAQRVEICRSSQFVITAYRFEHSDGSVTNAI